MDIRQYQGSNKYLKAADLKGRSVVVTIQAVVEEMVGQGRDTEQKPVLSFVGKEKKEGPRFTVASNPYVGIWEADNMILEISLTPEKSVKEEISFGGKTCHLTENIRVHTLQGPSQKMYVKEGIYDCGLDYDAIMAFCNHCGRYVIMGVRRNGANIEFGCSKTSYCFKKSNKIFTIGGHELYKRKDDLLWTTFSPLGN